ncbi:MAG: methyltransferase domain-containing protein [Betaproteobacteria bacterium]|nr:methyltransferase domain-containing protein [Betaproteobacteria bacterium]MDE2132264.1 methyltransferase domain-containing protein [Betaproteobacteria bacterium]MDE2212475.1 methyltransferase domain-containing protein [Betaproteobacteria bacterium]
MTPETARLRRAFDRHAGHHAEGAVLAQEIGRRLLEHLAFLKPAAHRILDLGAGTGAAGDELRRLFPQAEILSADFSCELLRLHPSRRRSWWTFGTTDRRHRLCANAGQLPLAGGVVDLVWANLLLPSCDPQAVIQEVQRVLAPEGLFIFSTLGPDTLKELKQVFGRHPDGCAHVQEFADMHDVGDALVHAGFADPVMDREDLTATYPALPGLLRDLRLMGGINTLPERRRTLTGRQRWKNLTAEYERLRRSDGLPATFEIVYGHAWKPAPRTMPDGRPIIGLKAA